MLEPTLQILRCPAQKGACNGNLELEVDDWTLQELLGVKEIQSGRLSCAQCETFFPIISGVAIVVPDVDQYIREHIAAITRYVNPEQLALKDAGIRHLFENINHSAPSEWDLESERVTSWYFANHYLSSEQLLNSLKREGITPGAGVTTLIEQFWDMGLSSLVRTYLDARVDSILDLGCSVGGALWFSRTRAKQCLGIDLSFSAIKLARQINLHLKPDVPLVVPGDRLNNPPFVTALSPENLVDSGMVDFVVGDVNNLPVQKDMWEVIISANLIDMLSDPQRLPFIQWDLLTGTGQVVHACPYVWTDDGAAAIRNSVPKDTADSATAVEWIYKEAGFQIAKCEYDLPWLFFKHKRQVELYALHAFRALKETSKIVTE